MTSLRLVPRAYCLRPQISTESESDRVGKLTLSFFKAVSSLPMPLQWLLWGSWALRIRKVPGWCGLLCDWWLRGEIEEAIGQSTSLSTHRGRRKARCRLTGLRGCGRRQSAHCSDCNLSRFLGNVCSDRRGENLFLWQPNIFLSQAESSRGNNLRNNQGICTNFIGLLGHRS